MNKRRERRDMLGLENNLNIEIEFWRELIDHRTAECPQETIERMRQALALAERKLQLLQLSGFPETYEQQDKPGKEH